MFLLGAINGFCFLLLHLPVQDVSLAIVTRLVRQSASATEFSATVARAPAAPPAGHSATLTSVSNKLLSMSLLQKSSFTFGNPLRPFYFNHSISFSSYSDTLVHLEIVFFYIFYSRNSDLTLIKCHLSVSSVDFRYAMLMNVAYCN